MRTFLVVIQTENSDRTWKKILMKKRILILFLFGPIGESLTSESIHELSTKPAWIDVFGAFCLETKGDSKTTIKNTIYGQVSSAVIRLFTWKKIIRVKVRLNFLPWGIIRQINNVSFRIFTLRKSTCSEKNNKCSDYTFSAILMARFSFS